MESRAHGSVKGKRLLMPNLDMVLESLSDPPPLDVALEGDREGCKGGWVGVGGMLAP